MSELYKYNGVFFSEEALLFLKPSFLLSYLETIRLHPNDTALVIYAQNGSKSRYDYLQVHTDVLKTCRLISDETAPNQTVVVHGKNSYEFVVFCLSVILSGRTLCPISSREPLQNSIEKLRLLGEQVFIFSNEATVNGIGWIGNKLEIPITDTVGYQISKPSTPPLIRVFTSGSTGALKIVEQKEEGVLSNVDALIDIHKLTTGKTILTALSLGHVNALEFALFGSFLAGQKLVLLEVFDLKIMLNAIKEEQADIVSVIPPILQNILQNSFLLDRFDLSSVKYFVTAATYLGPQLAQKWLDLVKIPLLQGYGLSEAINFSCLLPPGLSSDQQAYWLTHFEKPSVGPALRGNDIAILDENGLFVAEGEIGELCIRGWGVMRGYMHEDNIEIFKWDFLHSGDLGYYHLCSETGEKYYFIDSRKKEIIKRNGYNISLTEIESAGLSFLTEESGADAIAVGFENDYSGEEVALFIRSSKEYTSEFLENLKAQLVSSLDEDSFPRLIVVTAKNLRNISGKPDRLQFKEFLANFRTRAFGKKIQTDFLE